MREIQKFKIEEGYVAYKMRKLDAIIIFNSLGICDYCAESDVCGYYIPVLNCYYCEECFNDWKDRCIYYEEDIWYENLNIKFVDKVINQNADMKLLELEK